jgi:hypothetical protein
MLKVFRAWDGKEYWYAYEDFFFQKGYEATELRTASFTADDVDQFIGKTDSNGVKIFENDIIYNPMLDPDKLFQVIWSNEECGFRKIPLGKDLPVTKIDEAFMIVKGTIKGL